MVGPSFPVPLPLVSPSVTCVLLPRVSRDRLLLCPQKTQKPYEEVLVLKTLDSQRLQRCMVWFRQVRAPGRPCEGWALAYTDLGLRRGPALVPAFFLDCTIVTHHLKEDSCLPGP